MTTLTGRIVRPGDPGWDDARHGFADWADYDGNVPVAVVFCQSALDVSNAVKWARAQNLPFRPRCGRHSYEAYSSLVKGGIIIDVSEIDFVHADSQSPTALLGAGLSMEHMFEALGELGLTVPGATGPTVGLSGLALGGGFGVTSRKWGLTCDNVIDIELVNAHGDIIHANEHHHPDLYWACRGGGGGNFGIVTAFTVMVHPVNNVAVYNITWRWDQFDEVVKRWQKWAPGVDWGLSTALALLVTREINMYGQFTADDADLPKVYELLREMTGPIPPVAMDVQMAPHLIGTRIIMHLDPHTPQESLIGHSDRQIYKSTSAVARDPFPDEAIRLLRTNLEAVPPLSAPPSQPSMVQLLGGGGIPGDTAPDATAVFYRKIAFVVQYDAYWTAPQDGTATLDWISNFRTQMEPYTVGAYVNYVDNRIEDYLRAYYGDNLERLVEVKRKYDPDNVFNFPQSIPVSLPVKS